MREPMEIFARFGRQLLVEGVTPTRQLRLGQWCLSVATDGSELARQAAGVALRYGVGAGVGRVALADAPTSSGGARSPSDAAALQALDSAVTIIPGTGNAAAQEARPPVAHVYFAERGYGASVDFLLLSDDAGWDDGHSHAAAVTTVVVELGEGNGARPGDAVAIGTLAARLLVDHVLELAELPAILHLRWPDGDADPEVSMRQASESGAEVADLGDATSVPGLFAEIVAAPSVLAAVLAHGRAHYPNEACGFIIRDVDGALRTVPSRNLQDRYHGVDPEAYPRTSRSAFKLDERLVQRHEEAGESLAVIFHTHCDVGAYFSAEDARAAAPDGEPVFPAAGHLVVSVIGGEVRALELYTFDPETRRFVPERQPSGVAEALHSADPRQ